MPRFEFLLSPVRIVLLGLVVLFAVWSSGGSALADGLDYVQRLGSGTGLDRPSRTVTTRDGSFVFVLQRSFAEGFVSTAGTVASFATGPDGAPRFVELLHAGVGPLAGFQEPEGLALSPDDRFLYLGGQVVARVVRGIPLLVPAIATLAIGPDGDLTFRSLVHFERIERLASHLAPSPDGRHFYVLARGQFSGDPVLAVFEQNPATGGLRLLNEDTLESLLDLREGTLSSVSDLAVAPDGRHLYVVAHVSLEGTTIYTLVRDPESGRIIATRPLPAASEVPELAQVLSVAMTGDGILVYAPLTGGPDHLEPGRDRLVVFRRDETTGDLVAPRVFSAPPEVEARDPFVAVSPDDLHAYQCLDEETLQVYRVDHAFGTLEPIQTVGIRDAGSGVPGCDDPLLSRDGRALVLALSRFRQRSDSPFIGEGSLTRLERDPAAGTVTVAGATLNGEGGPQGLDDLEAAVVSPDGRHVYALREGWEVVALRRRTEELGKLEPLPDPAVSLDVDADPTRASPGVVVAPDGRHLYVGFDEELLVLARDPASGSLRVALRSTPGARGLAISGDGRHVYARSSEASITAYGRNPETGELTALQDLGLPSPGASPATGLALSPDGRSLYATTAAGSGALAVLSRDPEDGRLGLVQELDGELDPGLELDGLLGVAVSPDGRHVIVGARLVTELNPRLLIFDRHPEDGSLSRRDESLWPGWGFAFSPEGRSVYVLGGDPLDPPTMIRAFLRDPISGELEPDGALFDHGLGVFRPPAVSPDGSSVYVAGPEGISTFASRWFESPEVPGFRFRVSIDTGTVLPLVARPVAGCLPETACVHGAVPGRTEALLRIVGPKPNGRLWPTLVKFTTSPIDVEIDQLATGELRSYHLPGASPGSDELPGLFDREGFEPLSAASGIRWTEPAPTGAAPPPVPAGEVFTSPEIAGFRFQVRLTAGDRQLPARQEDRCFEETLCVSGAVPGRSELFLRIVGPKPNGRLWPTLVRTTTSTAEVWIEQVSTGEVRYYRLEGATPGSTDLTGLFDRDGFLP